MIGEYRHSGGSPRFPSPWQQALSDPSINIKVSPVPSPFLRASTSTKNGDQTTGRRFSTSFSEDERGDSLSSTSEDDGLGNPTDRDLSDGSHQPITNSFSSCTSIASTTSLTFSPISPSTPPSMTRTRMIHTSSPLPNYPSQQSLILSPSKNGRTTKLVAERDKTGHIEYKLKLDAKVGGERFERLVTQLRWR
jgi:hypothetical protein